jgi:hypothetical protein
MTQWVGFSFTPLFAALAPLARHHNATSFRAVLFGKDWEFNQSDVLKLAGIFGPKLSHLYLDGISLHSSGWTKLASEIPTLRTLELHGEEGTVTLDSWDLVAYCIRRGSSSPQLTLTVDGWLSPELENRGIHQVEEQLNELFHGQGCTYVTVKVNWNDG